MMQFSQSSIKDVPRRLSSSHAERPLMDKVLLHSIFDTCSPLFGVPKRIISDRDTRFTSHFSKAVCKATHIQQNFSTAFHPRTDGQSERMNQWIETYLRNFVNGRQDNWSDLLPIAEFTHNSWTHEATKHSPHELITGSTPSAKITPLDDSVPSAQNRLLELAKARI